MFRLYSNENFPLPVVDELRRLGCDVMTVMESGRAGQAWPDEEVLNWASADDRVLITLNRKDFFRIHRVQPNMRALWLARLTLILSDKPVVSMQHWWSGLDSRTTIACESAIHPETGRVV